MTALTQVRYNTIARVQTLFEANAAVGWTNTNYGPPQLWLGYPGSDQLGPEDAYVVRTDGVHTPHTFATRRNREDQFTLHIELQAAVDGQADTVAYQRAEQLFAFFENALADHDQSLGDTTGGTGTNAVDGLLRAFIGRVDGPYVINENVGWRGYLNFDIDCLAEYA